MHRNFRTGDEWWLYCKSGPLVILESVWGLINWYLSPDYVRCLLISTWTGTLAQRIVTAFLPVGLFSWTVISPFVCVCVCVWVCVVFFFFWPRGLRVLSSLTRDRTCAPCSASAWSLNHWTTREVCDKPLWRLFLDSRAFIWCLLSVRLYWVLYSVI